VWLVVSRIAQTLGKEMDEAHAAREQAVEALAHARDAAEEANRAKSQFLANMSHELRTPLNAIIGYSELLQEEATDQNHEAYLPDLQRINAGGKHLLALINDVLDLSKLDAGKVEFSAETFALADMVREATTIIRPVVEKNGNQLRVECAEGLG